MTFLVNPVKTTPKTLKTALKNTATRYKTDKSGQFSIMFGVTILALLTGLACAVDLSSAYFAKQRLQNTADQISLYAARAQITDAGLLTQAAQDYMDLNYPGAKGNDIVINSVTRVGDTVSVDASNTVDTDFAKLIGKTELDVRVKSVATYSERSLDLAFVLDSTGSMDGAKMTALKSSATKLVDTLDDYKVAQVRASVVPFSNYVNVGQGNRNAKWLQLPKEGKVTLPERCDMRSDVISKTNCRKVKTTCENDGVVKSCMKTVCDVKRGPKYEVCYTPTYTAKWEGCVGSRDVPYNSQAGYNGRKIPGLPGDICGTELQPLTKNLKAVSKTIKALDAKGNTYMPSGLLWGWRTLNDDLPLTQASKNKKINTQKVLILMTDGNNTRSKGGDWHEVKNGIEANALTQTLCSAIKSDDIRVFSIAYDIADSATQDLVKDCASDSTMYFEAADADDLEDAFIEIGNSLSTLRLTN